MDERVEILQLVIKAIIHIHSKRMVHLDIKPENIFLNYHENSKNWNQKDLVLADFGISYRTNRAREKPTCSGTPGFGAPEQFIAKPQINSDNYSLDAVF